MGDAPKKIYAGPNSEDVWGWPDAAMFPDPPRCVTPYIHEDECKAREDAAYKRGLEDAAKIAEEKHRVASDAYLRVEALGIRSVINAIRAQIEERDK